MQRKIKETVRTEVRPTERSVVIPHVTASPTCCHIDERKDNSLLYSFALLHAFYVSCIRESSFRRKKSDCICQVPNCTRNRKRIHACLSCIYFGCFKDHVHSHAEEQEHPLAVDTDFGRVYCAFCADYKYDPSFEKIAQQQNIIASRERSRPYKWEPSLDEVQLLKFHDIVYSSKSGIRGLVNISNFTCYLSSTIQCLIHAPVFRDYLLSFEHRCNKSQVERPSCFMCEMSSVLQECFSDKKEPYDLSRLLCLLYKRVNILAMTQMQDASEVLTHLLENFHEDETNNRNPQDCDCIIHSVFRFQFKKQRTCRNKQSPHVTYLEEEGRWDISFYQLTESTVDTEVSFKHCLDRSLFDERDDAFCPGCQANVGYTIQLIPKKLPYVMVFCTNEDPASNGKTFMTYEKYLDMSSYMFKPDCTLDYMYYLFAVIEFIGTLSSGHYKCYVRKQDDVWYLCNDKEVEQVDWDEVSEIRARLLFYHRIYV